MYGDIMGIYPTKQVAFLCEICFEFFWYIYIYNGIVAAPDRNSGVICNCVNYGLGSYLELQ